ncbi:MAG: hypothetical protein M1398_05800 [Deltaproteobacteria bacterium]|jgi:aspartokinase|nr:hypothetical protein [Deltaproteobacteria bacterium]MDA8307979.1 hypothetical protein [Deltaproteobacteria bacterium]
MPKIQLGGIKILEGRSYAAWSCEKGANALADICSHMAAERINLSQVTHIVDDGRGLSSISLCTESGGSFTSYLLLKLDTGIAPQLRHDTTIVSVFPHDRRPRVMGALLELMGRDDMHALVIASSPSAMSIVVPSEHMKATIEGIFSAFEFPAYGSPLKWETAYVGKEQLFRDVVGSYEEQDIKVYAVLDQPGLDLWALILNRRELTQMGPALREVDGLQTKIPFLVADCSHLEKVLLSFCLPASQRKPVSKALDAHLPHTARSLQDAAGVFFHGPHFGDRYRIAGTLTESMQAAGIHPLALSCAVHSISVILKARDLPHGLQVIKTKFHVPTDNN